MSSSKVKNKGSGKARALAAWEWFKEAAWLQVLLIVGIVVGLVVAIPFVVKGITDIANNDDSKFYKSNRITYTQLEKYLNGSDKTCDGYIGDNQFDKDGKIVFENGKTGFVVMFYKSNCPNCDSMEKHLEKWYSNFNKKYGEGNIKFYTVDVSWVVDDDDKATEKEGNYADYSNKYISLEQQQFVQDSIRDVYLDQDDEHQTSTVEEETLKKRLDGATDGGTLPTPCFLTFSKDVNAANYISDVAGYEADTEKTNIMQYVTPRQVIFGAIGSLSLSNATDVAREMNDIYFFQTYKGKK